MPIYIDILENKVLGRERKKGIQEGRQEGRQEGELTILRRLIERRFGTLPAWAEQRLGAASTEQLEELATRVLDAARLEDLLNAPPA
jgi:predicted transposase YdaD